MKSSLQFKFHSEAKLKNALEIFFAEFSPPLGGRGGAEQIELRDLPNRIFQDQIDLEKGPNGRGKGEGKKQFWQRCQTDVDGGAYPSCVRARYRREWASRRLTR
jgi:hypothetical protein